jgi:hypothetical protein
LIASEIALHINPIHLQNPQMEVIPTPRVLMQFWQIVGLAGEISAAEPPVDVLPPPAATNVCNEAGGQGQIEESPRKASVNCLDLFLPAYPWEEASETTSLLEKTTAAAKQGKEGQ